MFSSFYELLLNIEALTTLRKKWRQRHLTMPKRHLLHHSDLENARSCLALEREYWQALKILDYADGWNNWREFFLMQVLSENPGT